MHREVWAWSMVAALGSCSLAGCAAVRDQIVAQNVNGCVKKTCRESEAVAYKDCEAACVNRYGR